MLMQVKRNLFMYAHSTPDSNVEEQYSISIFHINKIYRYILYSLSKMSYVVFLNFDCLGVKLLNLPVPANNQTDTVQISINSATALLLLWHTVLCGLISTAPFLTEKKLHNANMKCLGLANVWSFSAI